MAPVHGVHARLRELGVKGMTTKEVADEVGVSAKTILRWRQAGVIHPKHLRIGKLVVYVFSPDDVAECVRLHAEVIKPGRKSKEDKSVRVSYPQRVKRVRPSSPAVRKAIRNKLAAKRNPGGASVSSVSGSTTTVGATDTQDGSESSTQAPVDDDG